MVLGELLKEVRNKYDEVSAELEPYRCVVQVERFLELRGQDLKTFVEAVREYDMDTPTGVVLDSLREKGIPRKIYCICDAGASYFDITKKVEKAIAIYDEELLRQAAEVIEIVEAPEVTFEYAIPDELTSEQFQRIFQ